MKFFQKKTPFQNRRWSKTRKLGWLGFTLLFGVLYWGGLMAAGHYIYYFHISSQPSRTLEHFVTRDIPIWLIAGAAWGTFMWIFTERGYRKYLALHPEENPETPAG